MTEKIRDGISRELRYVEYKLRKRKSEKNKKKQSSPMGDPSLRIPDDFKQDLPANHGEEDLQLEVALAMSKEEAKDKEKAEISDKMRLEMALKESAEVAAKVMAKHSPSHSAAASTSQVSDPWGAPTSQTQQSSFDPFRDKKETETNDFGLDAWGAPAAASAPQPRSQVAFDPWSSAGGDSGTLSSNATNLGIATNQATADPWSASVSSSNASSNFEQKIDPWNSGKQQSKATNIWGNDEGNNAGVGSTDPWGSTFKSNVNEKVDQSGATDDTFDPFSLQSATISSNSLNDFSQLSIQPSQPVSSLELFSSDVMVPQVVDNSNYKNVLSSSTVESSTDSGAAEVFLGNNANLVNIDSLVEKPVTTHPYITMNTSGGAIGASRNPFNQKGPSPSLNQMKPGNTNMFGNQVPLQSAPFIQPSTLPPTGFNMPVGGLAPGQQGFPLGIQPASNPFLQPAQSAPTNQSNQLLF